MQFVSPVQLLNKLFFKLLTGRGMLHSNFKPKLVVFDKTLHFNAVTLSQSCSYKEKDLASLFLPGKMLMECLVCFC